VPAGIFDGNVHDQFPRLSEIVVHVIGSECTVTVTGLFGYVTPVKVGRVSVISWGSAGLVEVGIVGFSAEFSLEVKLRAG
jgi:hypothetical protein